MQRLQAPTFGQPINSRMEPERPSSLGSALAYSGMAAAFLLPHGAEAQVAWTDVDPDLVLQNGEHELDLDGDGTTDLTLVQASYSDIMSAKLQLPEGNAVRAMATFSGLISPAALEAAEPIGPANADWHTDNGNGLILAMHSSTNWGNWLGTEGYLGCRFTAGDGQDHYAWVQLQVAGNASQLKVKAYGHEQTAASELLAGEGSPQGLAEQPTPGLLLVFPNPAQDRVEVPLPLGNGTPATAVVLDATGRICLHADTGIGLPLTLDLATLAPGGYTVQLSQGGAWYTARVLKQ
jgi:hypothetical protein